MRVQPSNKYYLYIDECGDHQLEKFNPNFPIFTLCGFLVPGEKLEALESAVRSFKREFFNDENVILHSRDIRKQEILKEPFVEKFSRGEDVYGLSLKYLIERAIFCMDDSVTDGTLDVFIERRGVKQDRSLLNYYNRLRALGTKWVSAERLGSRLGRFIFKYKKDNIVGLQLADLIAYPITRHVLDPKSTNPAFEIIRDKIYAYKGAVLGMKIIPH